VSELNTSRRVLIAFVTRLLQVMGRDVWVLLALMIAVSAAESVSLVLLVPMMEALGLQTGSAGAGQIAGAVRRTLDAVGLGASLPVVVALYAGAVASQTLLSRWQTTAFYRLEHTFVARLRRQLYRSITGSTWTFFIQARASDFTHALTSELQRVGVATYQLMGLAGSALVGAVYIGFALRVSPVMTGLAIVCGLVPLLLVGGRIRRAAVAGDRIDEASQEFYAATIEHLAAAKTAKSYGAEDRSSEVFERLARAVARTNIDSMRLHVNDRALIDLAAVATLAGLLLFAVRGLHLANAEVLLLLFLFARVMPRLTGLYTGMHGLLGLLPSFRAVKDLQARCEAAREPAADRAAAVAFRRHVRCEQVTYRYPARTTPAIARLSLTIDAGLTTAIVGVSGSGKSTLADLLLGLLTPDEGQVLIDDVPLDPSRMTAWREQIGYVAQETFLFHDTVRANMLWACPAASDADIVEVFRQAAADQFVAALPHGLDTVLGDRGMRLSGGERQRLALARALLRRPTMLVLDEATSALDSDNERLVMQSVQALRGRVAMVIITHRLSTIRGADRVHVLDSGRLVESGSWDDLIADPGSRLAALCHAQEIESPGIAGSGARTSLPLASKTITGT
jgi:ATP-binding cassette, subfamily C, bacterial